MSLREELGGVLVCDARYSWQAYLFIFETLEYVRVKRQQAPPPPRKRARKSGKAPDPYAHHIDGRALCEAARELASRQFGLLALMVLRQWGIRSTSDLGEIVYHLIAAGDLEKTPIDSRSDFDNVFEFEAAFSQGYDFTLDEPT